MTSLARRLIDSLQEAASTLRSPRIEPRDEPKSPEAIAEEALGPDSMPHEGVPKGELSGPFPFESKILRGPLRAPTIRNYWLYVPAQCDKRKPSALFVFQDGQRAVSPRGLLRVPTVMDNLIHKREMPITIGIFISPGHVGRVYPAKLGRGNPNNRSREYDVLTDAYARFLLQEMIPAVARQYNLTTNPDRRAIGGTSSGALCAFNVAWQRPHEFRNVVSMIGSFTNIRGAHVFPELVRASHKKPLRVFLQDGVNDLRNPEDPRRDWHLQNQAMLAALTERGYDVRHVFGHGGHSDHHGGALLPDILRWIWRDQR